MKMKNKLILFTAGIAVLSVLLISLINYNVAIKKMEESINHVVELEADTGSLPAPPPRRGHAPHPLRTAQGTRPGACAGRLCHRAGQHRRGDRHHQGGLESRRGA